MRKGTYERNFGWVSKSSGRGIFILTPERICKGNAEIISEGYSTAISK